MGTGYIKESGARRFWSTVLPVKPTSDARKAGSAMSFSRQYRLFNRGTDQDPLTASIDIKIIIPDVYTTCNVRPQFGCAPVYGNIDHHWSAQASNRAKSSPVDRPGHPGGWSAQVIRQGVVNCVHHLSGGLKHQRLVHCEKTIHVRGRAVLARRASLRLQPERCESVTRHAISVPVAGCPRHRPSCL